MGLVETIHTDMIAAMRSREELRLSTLRMVKTAFKNKEIDKRSPLTEAEALQILTTLIKQRRESIESFTKGNRPELAKKEEDEIAIIEAYMPKQASETEVAELVSSAISEITAASGSRPGQRDMGTVMKAVQAKIQAAGIRADGKQVSELVKRELAK